MPLVPQVTLHPFDKSVMEFVGPINSPWRRDNARYIVTTMDYSTRREEAALVMDCTAMTTTRFLFDNIVT